MVDGAFGERVGRAIELVSRLEEGEGVDARSPWWGSMINRPSWVRSRRPANRQLAITLHEASILCLARLTPGCRCSKSRRNLANLPNNLQFWGFPPISLQDLSASAQNWTWVFTQKVRSVRLKSGNRWPIRIWWQVQTTKEVPGS